ncbi:MAG: hypothetical protein JNM39_00715 [Bdellovibrionaceae bacterium]|nr:hypothetical protein [Pseudobdellovibrionaceae bacterium]
MLTAAFSVILASSCVSVSLDKNKVVPAKNVRFNAPDSPFEEIDIPNSDKTWISAVSGNTISFLSDCQKNSDPTLEQMLTDSFSVLEGLHASQSETLTYNSRQALQMTSEGFVDGVPIKMKALVFKRNSCNYTLTYAGVSKKFPRELDQFSRFLQSFYAP